MNPIVPVNPTIVAVITATMKSDTARTRFTSTPRLVALLSPQVMTPMSLEKSWRSTRDTSTTPVTIHTLSHDAGPRDPTFQVYSISTFSGSARVVMSDVVALKMYIMAIPARIIVVGVILLCLDISTMAMVGTIARMTAFSVTERL